VDAGQVAVEKDDVVGVEVELGRGLQPVAGDVDGHALVPQTLGHPVGEGAGILGHEHPHAATSAAATACRASGNVIVTVRPPSGRACS
jgi:hypothetical protein